MGPPCNLRLSRDGGLSCWKYVGSTEHKYRLAATCRRTGSTTSSPNRVASHRPASSSCRSSTPSSGASSCRSCNRCPTSCSKAAVISAALAPSARAREGGLQGVFSLRDRLVPVGGVATLGEQPHDL